MLRCAFILRHGHDIFAMRVQNAPRPQDELAVRLELCHGTLQCVSRLPHGLQDELVSAVSPAAAYCNALFPCREVPQTSSRRHPAMRVQSAARPP
jgi:hypothetical protein